MERAYVLINCDTGYEESIIKELKKMDSIKEIHGTLGVYDIIAKVESENQEKLKEAIIGDIRKLTNIKSTLTLMGAGDIDIGEKMAELIPDIIPEEKKPLEVPTDMNEDEEYDDEDDDFEEKKK
ncbi:MAG: AsnC family transcriptional regulator [Thaumarchaeota archaeon CSP1-1]|jgi:DNA-binding Lrp family transcriptional regulator|nr:MAG: AsnC family transcriptional regulator [Thaumarchaeota archaeon CSP1-1]